jgi:uncharacterized protein (DUF2147 family)
MTTGLISRSGSDVRARRVLALISLVALMLTAGQAVANAIGRWATEDHSGHIEIARCGEKLCGTLVWLAEPTNAAGKPVTDRNNPNPELRDRPVLGLTIVSGMEPARRHNMWENGTIYDPQSGNTYRVRMTLADGRTLQLRGYVGVPLLGRTSTWTRVPATLAE